MQYNVDTTVHCACFIPPLYLYVASSASLSPDASGCWWTGSTADGVGENAKAAVGGSGALCPGVKKALVAAVGGGQIEEETA